VEKPDEHGPFVRMVQIASADGSSILYDLKGLAELSETQPLIELFDNSRVTWLGHAFDSDVRALKNTDRQLAKIRVNSDTKLMWDALQHVHTVDFLSKKLGMSGAEIDLNKIGIPFHIGRPGLSTVCKELCGIQPSKLLQGSGFTWAKALSKERLQYAVLDPIITMDIYICGSMTSSANLTTFDKF